MSDHETNIRQLADDVAEIKEALLGDALKGKLGVLHHHNQMYADLYGIDASGRMSRESQKNSILARMSSVEDKQKKVMWWGAGVGAGAATAWAAILKFTQK